MAGGAQRNARRAAFSVAVALFAAHPAAADAPRRIVSIHLCADQLVLALAERSRIVSLSRLAADTKRSHMAAAAAGLPQNSGTAEEVVALDPDIVFAGFLSTRPAVAALRALGYRVVDLAFASDFSAIRKQIRRVARILERRSAGEALIGEMDSQLADAAGDAPTIRPLAAIYQPMGYTSGLGSLEHALLSAAGFDNLAARLGIGALGHISLETLIANRPALLVNWMGSDPHPSLARAGYAHPALQAGHWRVASLPHRFWSCGSWYSALAVERLASIRRSLAQEAGR